MRPKYVTPALVLARTSVGEASALVTLLTEDFGLVRARVQGVRKSGAKLAGALRTLSEIDASLLYGQQGWRLSGATQETDHFAALSQAARKRVGRVSQLLLRLVHGETKEPELFYAFKEFLESLTEESEEAQDAAECLVALKIMNALGLDAGAPPDLEYVRKDRKNAILRINKGIAASGL